MNLDEQALKQILEAYADGQINFAKVPAIQRIVQQETARQIAQQVNLEQIHAQEESQLQQEREWYHQQINDILQKQENQLDVKQVKTQVLADISQHALEVEQAQADLEEEQEELAEQKACQFWRNLIPLLAGVVVSVFFTLMILLLFKALLWDGIWHGLGLNHLTEFVLTVAKSHPFGGGLLGLVALILAVIVVLGSFWAMTAAVNILTKWDADKLMFWNRKC